MGGGIYCGVQNVRVAARGQKGGGAANGGQENGFHRGFVARQTSHVTRHTSHVTRDHKRAKRHGLHNNIPPQFTPLINLLLLLLLLLPLQPLCPHPLVTRQGGLNNPSHAHVGRQKVRQPGSRLSIVEAAAAAAASALPSASLHGLRLRQVWIIINSKCVGKTHKDADGGRR